MTTQFHLDEKQIVGKLKSLIVRSLGKRIGGMYVYRGEYYLLDGPPHPPRKEGPK